MIKKLIKEYNLDSPEFLRNISMIILVIIGLVIYHNTSDDPEEQVLKDKDNQQEQIVSEPKPEQKKETKETKKEEKIYPMSKEQVVNAVINKWETNYMFETDNGKFIENYEIRVDRDKKEININFETSLYEKKSNEEIAKRIAMMIKGFLIGITVEGEEFSVNSIYITASNGSKLYVEY